MPDASHLETSTKLTLSGEVLQLNILLMRRRITDEQGKVLGTEDVDLGKMYEVDTETMVATITN